MQQQTVETRETVAIRFAGDSGDGMQLTGSQFTATTALHGNDLATFPDFPAEIRAPAGTLGGVSGFQIHFGHQEIHTPGDAPDVLVAMNPAALKVNLPDLKPGGILVVNTEAFTDKNLLKAGFPTNPLEDDSLLPYQVYPVDITGITLKAITDVGLNQRAAVRCKNFFALGLVYWMFNRDMSLTEGWITEKFGDTEVGQANMLALKAGHAYGETAEIFSESYEVKPAPIATGRYRNITGNEATALGFAAAAELAGLQLFLGSYPITPASDVLHALSKMKHLGVRTFQAEDEIAAMCAAIGAAYGGALALTTTSGPGMALKAEGMGLAMMYELPVVIANIQRGGPSTGLPTKTEQADLLQSLFGRNGECPMPVVAAHGSGDCFWAAIEAARIAVTYMTPVIFLSDGYLANGAEPWPIPDLSAVPPFKVQFRTDPEGFLPYMRDERLSRPWALPGTPGLEHRLGGLEKQHETGNVSYDPENHEFMVKLRAEKVARVANELPPTEIFGPDQGELLVVGWGGPFGAIRGAVTEAQAQGLSVSHVHLRHLNPFPKDFEDILKRFDKVLVPELNMGQLASVIKARMLVDVVSYNKIQGKPFKVSEIFDAIVGCLDVSAAEVNR